MATSPSAAMKTRSKAKEKRPREDDSLDDEPQAGPAPKKMTAPFDDAAAAFNARYGPNNVDDDIDLLLPTKPDSSPPSARLAQFKELKARREIVILQNRLQEERERSRQREMQLKQSMFFDILRQQDKNRHLQDQLLKERKMVSRMKCLHATTMAGMQEDLQAAKSKQLQLMSEANGYQRAAEHQLEVCRMLDEDLDELKRLHNDERAAQRNYRLGLPPAYGSLDEEDQQPPWDLHADGGATDLTFVLDIARDMFRDDVNKARAAARAAQESNGENAYKAGAEIFVALFFALSEHCWRGVRHWLSKTDGWTDATHEYLHHKKTTMDTKQKRADRTKASLVAERFAELVLELLLRLLSVVELYPGISVLSPTQRGDVHLNLRTIDDTLLECLRQTFDFDDRLLQLQLYLTQLSMIRERLRDVWPRCHADAILDQSATWLAENVEKERQLAAQDASEGS